MPTVTNLSTFWRRKKTKTKNNFFLQFFWVLDLFHNSWTIWKKKDKTGKIMYQFVSKLDKVEICVHMFEWCKMQCSFNEILHQSKMLIQICFCFRKVITFFRNFFFPTVRPSFFPACYRKQNVYFVWPYATFLMKWSITTLFTLMH